MSSKLQLKPITVQHNAAGQKSHFETIATTILIIAVAKQAGIVCAMCMEYLYDYEESTDDRTVCVKQTVLLFF